jgi:hypothetical protein
MSFSATVKDQDNGTSNIHLDGRPDKCPLCEGHGQSDFHLAALNQKTRKIHAVFRCPVSECRGFYIAIYDVTSHPGFSHGKLIRTPLAVHSSARIFPENIQKISPSFCEIHNQTRIAEENGLRQICGPGYRKSLEFLIKDFLILHVFKDDPVKPEEIKKTFLGKVIESFVDDKRIQQCAKRATWLGNDETHYTRKWEDKDLDDLKSLIHITVNFIDSSIEADRYLADMTEVKPS